MIIRATLALRAVALTGECCVGSVPDGRELLAEAERLHPPMSSYSTSRSRGSTASKRRASSEAKKNGGSSFSMKNDWKEHLFPLK
jgi:hypothetical protein